MAWVKFLPSSDSTAQRILDRVTAGIVNGFNFDLFPINNNMYLRLCAGSKCMISVRYLRPSVWNHVAVTFDSTSMNSVNFYINGNHDSTHCSYSNPTKFLNTSIVLGATANPLGKERFTGLIDDVSIWSCVLNVTEVQKLLFQKLAGDELDLQLYYDFNKSGDNGQVLDATQYNRHGSLSPLESREGLDFEEVLTKPLYVTEYD